MSDRKMSDMIDAHSGFFQTVTSIHTMAAELRVSDKHIFDASHVSYFQSNMLVAFFSVSFIPKYFILVPGLILSKSNI